MELGIKGHETRGDEVIKILKMLGGKNPCNLTGDVENHFYYITNHYKDINNSYIGPDEIKGYMIFSLEDFLEKFPYKVGDKVNVWINYDYFSGPHVELVVAEIKSMRWNSTRCQFVYKMKDINREFYKDDIKGKVNDDEENLFHTTNEYEEIVEKSFQGGYERCKLDIQLNGYELPEGYHFTDENGNVIDSKKILLVKNSPSYPKTYMECCELLGYGGIISFAGLDDEEENLYGKFIVLKRCRDAYWKIAGEEMELGKSWEPDYDSGVNKYGIICMNGVVQKSNPTTNWERHLNKVLDFPTEKMRNAFYENFKDLIEQCKELL